MKLFLFFLHLQINLPVLIDIQDLFSFHFSFYFLVIYKVKILYSTLLQFQIYTSFIL